MKILFQGDSITDAGRDRSDPHDLGNGYPKYAAEAIRNAYPKTEFEFFDLGIGGDRAESLLARWEEDAIAFRPDVTSILIGINDTWHRAENQNWMPHDYFESCYRSCLEALKIKTNTKIIILEQFLCSTEDKSFFRYDLDPKIQITRKLAREYADAFIPLDGIFAAHSIDRDPTYWAADGVHPTVEGAKLIAGYYLEAFRKVLL